MAGEKITYLQRKLKGRGHIGDSAILPQDAIYEPKEHQKPDLDLESVRSQAIAEMAEASGATTEEVAAGLNYLESHPQFAAAIRNDFERVFNRARGLSPDALRRIVEEEVAILAEENPDPAAIQRLQTDGVLVPILMTKQATGLVEEENRLKTNAKQKVGGIKTSRKGRRLAIGGTAAGITVGAAYLDLTFSKQGLGNIVDVLTEKLGVDWMMQSVGRLASMNDATLSAVEQAAYGKGIVTMTLVLTALGYLGHEKWKAAKFSDLFRFRKHPVKATVNSALVAGFLALGSGGVTTSITVDPRIGAMSTDIQKRMGPSEAKLADAVKAARGLREDIRPQIDASVDKAFRTGVAKVGPLTASTWLAFNGDTPDASGRLIADRYEGQDRSKMQLIKEAVVRVNNRPEYKALGMKDSDGARQLLEYLTEPIPQTAEALSSHFKTLITLANERADVSLARAIFGKLNFLSAEFYRSPISPETIFKMQQQYPEDYIKLIEMVQKLQVISKYLSDVQFELRTGAARVNVDLSLQLALPNLGYSPAEIRALAIPRKDYIDVLEPNRVDAIVNLFWGTETAWKARQDITRKASIFGYKPFENNRMGESDGSTEVLMQRLAYEGAIYSIFLFLVIGSVLISGSMRKKLNRWYEADMDAHTEKLSEKEDEIINGIVAYGQALSAETSSRLRDAGHPADAINLVNDAFRKAVSVALRTYVAEQATDPRTGKPLSESSDAKAFIDREAGVRHFDDEDRAAVLKAYGAKLSEWQDRLAENPYAVITELMDRVDPAFRSVAQALVTANNTNPGTRERELAVESLRQAFIERERGLMSMEADQIAVHIARLQARRTAVEQMGGEENEIEVVLGADTPKFTQKELIASFILTDIDAEIHTWQRALDSLTERGAKVSPLPAEVQELTNAEWKAEQDAFLRREMERFAAGSDLGGDGEATLEKINAFVSVLGRNIVPIQEALDAHLKTFNPDAKVSFVYGYSEVREGPTITAVLSDASGLRLANVPFIHKIPSDQVRDTQTALTGIQDWAKPDGPLAQRLRVSTLFERTRGDYRSQSEQLVALNQYWQYDADVVLQNAPLFDAYLRSADMMRVQMPLMEKLIAGEALSAEEVRAFTEPLAAIRDVWRRSISETIEKSRNRRFVNIGNKRLMIGFKDDEGYIFATPQDAVEPIDIDAIPEHDKLLIKRAAIA
ncbi:MAG TPA: hypothetical protein VNM40_01650 [Candidatus Paceibacterota bacterium]|nr:hypothetical protein [Candidatus Paceibacterota bacterium]